jgi:hypothetical protein
MSTDERAGYLAVFAAARRCVASASHFGVRLAGRDDPAAMEYVARAVRRHLGDALGGIDPETARRAIADALAGRMPRHHDAD